MKEFLIRVVVAIGLVALLATVVYFGGWVQACALSLLSFAAVFEMGRMFKNRGVDICAWPLMLLALAQYPVLLLFGAGWTLALYVMCFTALIVERILNKKRTNVDVIAEITVIIYPLSLLLCMGLIGFCDDDISRIGLLMMFAAPCMADNNAYIFGRLIGKKKLCPSISPNKTVEGYIAGLIGGPMGGMIVWLLQEPLWGINIHWGWYVGLGIIGAVIGQFGDLFASTFKRWAGIKDFGTIFPKHGGIMDRLDSAMMFAPWVVVSFNLIGVA